MLLRPNQPKFKKQRKGKLNRIETKAINLKFGYIGLKSHGHARITARQIEAARQTITRHIKRKGRVWIRIFPDVPISQKPTETRMGKGKGAVNFWAARVSPGRILFEIEGVPTRIAVKALQSGSRKLPILTKIIIKT
jgi:large subunit ribosomal protein L16